MNTQQRLKQIKGLVQQAQAMHKPVFIGADELHIFIESLDAVERERDELRKTLAATQDGAAEAINHSLQLQSDLKASSANAMAWMKRALKAEAEIERRDAGAGDPFGYLRVVSGRSFQIMEGATRPPDRAGESVGPWFPIWTAALPATSVPEWSNEQVLEFLAIAFRHGSISGDVIMDDIRLGVKMANAAAPAPRGDQ